MAETEVDKWRTDLGNPDVAVRAEAAEHLCLAGPDCLEAATDLVQACGDAEAVRDWAVAALEDLGPPLPKQLPQLIELLASPEAPVVYWAATLVGRLGPSAATAEVPLTAVLTHTADDGARERAAWALGKIGVSLPGTLQTLDALTRDANPRLSRLAHDAMSHSQS